MKQKTLILRNNFYFLGMVFKIAPAFVLTSAVLRVVKSIRTMFMSVYFLQYMIACVEEGRTMADAASFAAVSFAVVSLTYALESAYEHSYKPICIEKISQSLMHRIFRKVQTTDMEMYDNETFYTSVVMANGESSGRALAVLENMLDLLEAFTAVTAILFYSLLIDWIVPVITIVSFLISYGMDKYIAGKRVDYDTALQKRNKEEAMVQRLLYMPEYAKDIRMTRIRGVIFQRYRENNRKKDVLLQKSGSRLSRLSAWRTILSASLCIDFLVPLYLAYRILVRHSLAASQFVAILNSCSQIQLKLEEITGRMAVFYQNGRFIERFRRVEGMSSKIETEPPLEEPVGAGDFKELELSHVSFEYGSGDFGLKDINLHIRKGEKITIAGKNGSGKTTLIKLLLRFYDCQGGSIRYNGIPIANLDIHDYRKAYASLFQDFNIYAASIAENIAMDLTVDRKRVIKALIGVGLEELVAKMDLPLTKEFHEDGQMFSGGQMQRIALARLLYTDKDILVMDEPTSAMDVKFEKQFYDYITSHLKDKTILFVSHRLTSAVQSDRILFMEDGRIAESGTHAQLMEKNGKYAEMFNAQLNAYDQIQSVV